MSMAGINSISPSGINTVLLLPLAAMGQPRFRRINLLHRRESSAYPISPKSNKYWAESAKRIPVRYEAERPYSLIKCQYFSRVTVSLYVTDYWNILFKFIETESKTLYHFVSSSLHR